MDIVREIENTPTSSDKPLSDVRIDSCGALSPEALKADGQEAMVVENKADEAKEVPVEAAAAETQAA